MQFFQNLDPLLKAFWLIASVSSLIFIIQTILTFLGADADHSMDGEVDVHGDGGGDTPFHLFTLRNLINFLLGFSWTGVSFFNLISNKLLLVALAVFVGCVFVLLFFLIVRQLLKLSEDNSFKITDTLNKTAEVYLTIPEGKTAKGKIIVSVNGSVHELEAMTDGERIASGKTVKIIRLENDKIPIVELI